MLKTRILAAALAVALIPASLSLQGCTTLPDGTVILEPDARAKLETALSWAKRAKAGANLAIVAVNSTCQGSTSDFCTAAMPIVAIASAIVDLGGKAIETAERALAATGTPEEQIAAAAADLIKFERDVEEFIQSLKAAQGAPAPLQSFLQSQMPSTQRQVAELPAQ